MRVIIGITGATGSIIGVRLLQALRRLQVETHLIVSRWGKATLEYETEHTINDLKEMADHHHAPSDLYATIASGSYRTDGMIISPCSMRTLAAVRSGNGEGLIARAADVVLKERGRLVLVPRETPLSQIHLENMLDLARMGVTILPPVPAFYNHPKDIDDLITHTTARILDQFGLALPEADRWSGLKRP